MKRLLAILCGVLVALVGCAQPEGGENGPSEEVDLPVAAQSAVESLVAGDPAPLHTMFSTTLSTQLTESALLDAWEQTIAPAGDYQGTVSVTEGENQGFQVVSVTSGFSEMSVVADLTFGESGEVEGIWFSYGEVETSEHPDPPALPDGAREISVDVGAYELAGSLTLPAESAEGADVVVLFISGSGPNDMDGSFGTAGNAVTRDLAYQLAEHGVASLRYEKRFHSQPELASAGSTIQDEVLDDAAAAVALLRSTPDVAGREIVVVGHSLGGMVLPAIIEESPDVAGGVIMAGTARSLWDVLLDQNEAAIAAAVEQGSLTEEQAAEQRENLTEEIARANTLTDRTEPAILGSLAAPYVVSLNELDLPGVAAELTVPLLVLQGESDFQVSPTVDFDSWEPVLAGNPDVTMHLFEGLNHFFMPASETADLSDYNIPNVVDPAVSELIARWLSERW